MSDATMRTKPLHDIMTNFQKHLAEEQAARQRQLEEEQAAFDVLPEEEKQRILDERREQEEQQRLFEKQQRQKEIIADYKAKGIPPRFYNVTWENWVSDTEEKLEVLNVVKGSAWETNLFLFGKSGTGKTHLAMCLAKDGATYRRFPDILREVKIDFNAEQEIIDYYGSVKLLIIDEIGRHKFSNFQRDLLFEIIDKRWNNEAPATLITNLSEKEFIDEYGTAVIDRLRPIMIEFSWESRRESLNLDIEPVVPSPPVDDIDF